MSVKQSVELLLNELKRARDLSYVIGYSVVHTLDLSHTKTKSTVHIQFASSVDNSTLDRVIAYIEHKYNIGVANRDFQRKLLTACFYDL